MYFENIYTYSDIYIYFMYILVINSEIYIHNSYVLWKNTWAKACATHCNTLQHTATHCNTLQHTATHCNIGQGMCTAESASHQPVSRQNLGLAQIGQSKNSPNSQLTHKIVYCTYITTELIFTIQNDLRDFFTYKRR